MKTLDTVDSLNIKPFLYSENIVCKQNWQIQFIIKKVRLNHFQRVEQLKKMRERVLTDYQITFIMK